MGLKGCVDRLDFLATLTEMHLSFFWVKRGGFLTNASHGTIFKGGNLKKTGA